MGRKTDIRKATLIFLGVGFLIYLLYVTGYIEIKLKRAIVYIGAGGNSYKNYHKAKVVACSGSVTAVLRLLHETDSLCLVASHNIELTKILQDVYDNYHFSEKFENDLIEFDYLLKEGPSRSTNAIRLLKFMGFDQRIVDEAVRIVEAD